MYMRYKNIQDIYNIYLQYIKIIRFFINNLAKKIIKLIRY